MSLELLGCFDYILRKVFRIRKNICYMLWILFIFDRKVVAKPVIYDHKILQVYLGSVSRVTIISAKETNNVRVRFGDSDYMFVFAPSGKLSHGYKTTVLQKMLYTPFWLS